MNPLKPAASYAATVVGRRLLEGMDGQSLFKVYFVDITGRPEPAKTEWEKCGIDQDFFLSAFSRTDGLEGVGFVTAFPHVVKAFRFGPEAETVLNVRAWNTRDLSFRSPDRSDRYGEFACLAEAILAADEFRFWADATTIDDYIAQWSEYSGSAIATENKLREYWKN